MSYMDIANIATDMTQAKNVTQQQLWGVKKMADNQANTVKELLGEVNNINNNPPQAGENVNVKA